jgi:hypothetical protein
LSGLFLLGGGVVPASNQQLVAAQNKKPAWLALGGFFQA